MSDDHEHSVSQPGKRGPKLGRKHGRTLTQKEWFALCELYVLRFPKMAHSEFLASDVSGDIVSGSKSECVSFGRRLKLFRNGELIPLDVKRLRPPQYEALEAQLVAYLRTQRAHWMADAANIWQHLLSRSAEWAHEMDDPIYREFKASPGWLKGVLKRNNIDLKSLCEAISEEDRHHASSASAIPHQLDAQGQGHQPDHTATLQWTPNQMQLHMAPNPTTHSQSDLSMSHAQQYIVQLRQFAIEQGISASGLGHLALFENELYQAAGSGS
jgi:hypothetical protein